MDTVNAMSEMEQTIWGQATIPKNRVTFTLRRRFARRELDHLRKSTWLSESGNAWIHKMQGEMLYVYRIGRSVEDHRTITCRFALSIRPDADAHEAEAFHDCNDADRKIFAVESMNLLRSLLDLWTGECVRYQYRNTSGLFSCDASGNLFHFDPDPNNMISLREWPVCQTVPVSGGFRLFKTSGRTPSGPFDWLSDAELDDVAKQYRPGALLRELIIPEGVRTIGRAMDIMKSDRDCLDALFTFESSGILGPVVFPASLVGIGYGAFSRCFIKEVCIPNTLRILGGFTFGKSHIHELKFDSPDPEAGAPDLTGWKHLNHDERLNLWVLGREFRDARVDRLLLPPGFGKVEGFLNSWLYS